MNLTKKRFLVLVILSVLFTNSQAIAASKRGKEEVKLPVQLKPERLELLNRIADEKIETEEYPYSTSEEAKEVIDRIKTEDSIISGILNSNEIKREYRTLPVSMAPSTKFKTINLVPNFSTTLVFVDKLGNPWSINKFIVGGADDYHPEQQSENIITFTPKTKLGDSNLTVIFENGKLPISLNLKINDQKVDYITEIKIDDYGNNSPKENEITFINTNKTNDLLYLSKNEETFMSEMLSNNRPEGFSELTIVASTGLLKDDYRVFHKKGEKFLYVKSQHSITSPKVVKLRNGVDKKTKVMKIPYTTSIWATEFGKLEKLKIKNQ